MYAICIKCFPLCLENFPTSLNISRIYIFKNVFHWIIALVSRFFTTSATQGFPCVKVFVNAGDISKVDSIPGLGRPQSRILKPPPVFLPGKFHGQMNLTGYSHGTAESNMTEQLSTDLLLIYNIVSTLQQSDSAIHIFTYILLHIIFHYSLLIMNIVPCPVK